MAQHLELKIYTCDTQNKNNNLGSHQQSPAAVDVTQGQGDVDKHNGVADYDGADIAAALSVYFIFNTPLCTKGYSQVGVFEVLHEFDESEMDTRNNTISIYAINSDFC